MKTLLTILIALTLLVGQVFSADLLVPEQFAKIQSAIEAAQDGDRVLIADGLYRERINFLGKVITVCGNLENPERVIIKPDTAGSIVVFKNGEGAEAVLCGVTLRGGNTDYGAGIFVKDASPSLHNLVLDSSKASQEGGGIFFDGDCRSVLMDVSLNLDSAKVGGGISCVNGASITADRLTILRCLSSRGGGIYLNANSTLKANYVTIRRSVGWGAGGGVYLDNSSMIDLKNFTIESCSTYCCGGGIYGDRNSSIDVRMGVISKCICLSEGGGVWIKGQTSVIERVLFTENRANDWGSAIATVGIFENQNVTYLLNHLTITTHQPDFKLDEEDGSRGFVLYLGANTLLTNSVIYGNQSEMISSWRNARITYSLLSDPANNWKNGNLFDQGVIFGNPLYVNAGQNDFRLQRNSPCINRAAPDSPKDPDGSTADMGCYSYTNPSLITGYVMTMDQPPEPIVGATVKTNLDGYKTVTNDSGYFAINLLPLGQFTLIVQKEGFIDSLLTGLNLENDTIRADFKLKSPKLSASVEQIDREIQRGEKTSTSLTLRNFGLGSLKWDLNTKLPGGWSDKPWGFNRSIPLPGINQSIDAVTYCGGNLVIASRKGMEKLVIVCDNNLNELSRFPQPGAGVSYIRDLDTDGEVLYGSRENKVYSITLAGESKQLFSVEGKTICAIAWDKNLRLLWMTNASKEAKLNGYDLQGQLVKTVDKPEWVASGLAYWENAPRGNTLLLLHSVDDISTLTGFNPQTGRRQTIASLSSQQSGSLNSCSITDQYAPYGSTAFLSSESSAHGRFVSSWSVESRLGWLTIAEGGKTGVLQSGEEVEIEITLSATDIDTGVYEAYLQFDHTGIGESLIVNFTLTVLPEVSVSNTVSPLPTEFAITSFYPNPFNARLTVEYSLPQAGDVTVRMYDIGGREVHKQTAGTTPAGHHRLTMDCTNMPNGLYLVQVTTGGRSITKKALLLK